MSVRAVIDTNVLVSSFLSKNPNSPTVRIARAIANGVFTPVFSKEMLEEYEEVLGRCHFKFTPSDISILLGKIKEHGMEIAPIDSSEDSPDPDDKVFFCTALAGDARLVTGNARHYPKSTIVVSPGEFCKIAAI